MKKYATISPCGTYRYWLERIWAEDPEVLTNSYVNFVMLNPSTADAERDDPTIRKCIGFAQRWGCDAMHVVNLFALRSTDPRALLHHPDPFGPDNPSMIRASLLSAGRTIVAWGANARKRPRGFAVFASIVKGLSTPPRIEALRVNQDGSPQHPLYVPYDVTPVPFSVEMPETKEVVDA